MKDGFIKVAAATPDIEVGNTAFNTEHILSCMQQAQKEHVKLLVFPELCISGYTCNDLFLQDILLDGCLAGLEQIRSASAAMDMVIVAGLPFLLHARLYNVAAVLFRGRLLGLVPKQHIPNYSEFYEARHFAPAPAEGVFTVNFPIGVGVKYKIAHRINIGCEFTMRFSLSDKLDVSNKEGLQLNDPYRIKSQGWKNKDSYSYTVFFVTYDLFSRCKECNN